MFNYTVRMKASLLLCVATCICMLHCASSQDIEQDDGIGGADSAYFLMEFSIDQIMKPAKMVERIAKVLRRVPSDNEGNGELVWLFKILGENKVLAVAKNTPEPFWEAVTHRMGDSVRVTTTPLRPYEHFAHSINKVDLSLCGPSPRKLQPGLNDRIYYIDATFHYKGFTMEELRTTWPKESKMMLEDRAAGNIQIEFFKVIGSNRVIVFMVGHPDALDDLTFHVPLVVELGDNAELPMKEIKPL